jgi:hypothetical protein
LVSTKKKYSSPSAQMASELQPHWERVVSRVFGIGLTLPSTQTPK